MLREILEQLPVGQNVRRTTDNIAENLIFAAKVFGHDPIFGAEYEGEIEVEGKKLFFTLRRKPMSLVKVNHLLEFVEKERKAEEKAANKMKARGRR